MCAAICVGCAGGCRFAAVSSAIPGSCAADYEQDVRRPTDRPTDGFKWSTALPPRWQYLTAAAAHALVGYQGQNRAADYYQYLLERTNDSSIQVVDEQTKVHARQVARQATAPQQLGRNILYY